MPVSEGRLVCTETRIFAQGLAHIASLSSRARIPLPLTTLCALPFSFRRPRFVLSSHLGTLRISCVRRDGSSWLQQFCLYADWCGNERFLLEFCPPASVEIHSLKTGPTPENLSPWLKTYKNTTAWLASLRLALISKDLRSSTKVAAEETGLQSLLWLI